MFSRSRVYLDAAAGATGNPSSPHTEGREAKRVLEEARTAIARLAEVQSDDVLFTSGATEGNALAMLGHVRALRQSADADAPGRNNLHVLYLPSAHASIVENAKLLAAEGVAVEPLPIKDARIDVAALKKMIRPETVLVSMDAVCGETGVIWNTREVKQAIGKVLLHVDASQAPLTEKVTRAHFAADLLVFDGSKVGDARGIGAVIAHRTIPLVPIYAGGGQERGLRSGSESPELAARFATALHTAANNRETFRAVAAAARSELVGRIMRDVSNVYINEGKAQAPNVLNVSLPGRDTDYLVALLDEAGFAISTRSACETDSQEGSRAIFALTGDAERSKSTLRISWGPRVSERDLGRFASALAASVAFIDSSSRG